MRRAAESGISEAEFLASSLRYIIWRINGAENAENRQHKAAWEQARMMAFYSVIPHDSKRKIKKPSDLVKFDWDATVVARSKESEAELKAKLNAMAADFFNEPPPVLN